MRFTPWATRLVLTLSLSATAFLTACGGGGSGSTAQVRLLNATQSYAQLDLTVNDKTIKSLDELKKAAIAKHPGSTVKDSELEDEYGRYIYKVELRDTQNVEWDVALDAKTGEVLKDERDN